MSESYGRDLDLNLLRVFVVVASAGSVTQAAAQLYLTQPAISAALRRLTRAVGAPLFVRSGRGLVLTQRGQRLLDCARPLLEALVEATLASPTFDPATCQRSVRIGLAGATDAWLLPPLLRALERLAPELRVISVPVQFRTVQEALELRRVDMAVTVADELPVSVQREPLLGDHGFVCLFDPAHVPATKRMSERQYFERGHVIVSYNGDLRGVVEDALQKQRRVRCAVGSFSHLGDLVAGTALVATVPRLVARYIIRLHPQLVAAELPFSLPGGPLELLWPAASDDDDACRFVREQLRQVARALG